MNRKKKESTKNFSTFQIPKYLSLLKEVIQPHFPVGLPCYDLVPVISLTLGASPLTVGLTTSGTTNSHDLTGGVYKTRERIHGDVLTRHY